MHKYIVDTLGMFEVCQNFEHLFEFYPKGFNGLIADYLAHHAHHPDDQELDQAFVDGVFQQYYESQHYHDLYANDAEKHHVERAILAATYLISHTANTLLKQQQHLLQGMKLSGDAVEVGTQQEYLLLEKH
jgi:hypothetical protein